LQIPAVEQLAEWLPLFLNSNELAVHFFNLIFQVSLKQLGFDTSFAKELLTEASNFWIRIKHPDDDTGYLSINQPLSAWNFRMHPCGAGFEGGVNGGPGDQVVG
jgi:hypothetical protein